MAEPKFKPGDTVLIDNKRAMVLDDALIGWNNPKVGVFYYHVRFHDSGEQRLHSEGFLRPAERWVPCPGKHRVSGSGGHGSGHPGPWERLEQ